MTSNEEVIVKYNSTSLPNPAIVFGSDVLILVKDNNLLSSIRIVSSMFFMMQ